jgi:hypothetical protein
MYKFSGGGGLERKRPKKLPKIVGTNVGTKQNHTKYPNPASMLWESLDGSSGHQVYARIPAENLEKFRVRVPCY